MDALLNLFLNLVQFSLRGMFKFLYRSRIGLLHFFREPEAFRQVKAKDAETTITSRMYPIW